MTIAVTPPSTSRFLSVSSMRRKNTPLVALRGEAGRHGRQTGRQCEDSLSGLEKNASRAPLLEVGGRDIVPHTVAASKKCWEKAARRAFRCQSKKFLLIKTICSVWIEAGKNSAALLLRLLPEAAKSTRYQSDLLSQKKEEVSIFLHDFSLQHTLFKRKIPHGLPCGNEFKLHAAGGRRSRQELRLFPPAAG